MTDRCFEDRVRDRLSGRLPAEDADALVEALRADPALAARQESYERAFHATRALVGTVPPCALEVGDLPVPARRRHLRWVAAAAACLLVALGVFWGLDRGGAPAEAEPYRLAAISLAPPPAPDPARVLARVPLAAVGYRSSDAEGVRWLEDPAKARALARWTGRPVLHYGALRVCPLCRKMERDTFPAPEVRARVEDFVPLREELSTADPARLQALLRQGWPHFASEDADGEVLAALDGYRDGAAFAAALESARPERAPAPWDRFDAWLRAVGAAGDALAATRYGEAWGAVEGARALAENDAWRAVADDLAAVVRAAAADALEDARGGSDPASALDAAARRFADSPFAADFRALAARVRATGRMPDLVEDSR